MTDVGITVGCAKAFPDKPAEIHTSSTGSWDVAARAWAEPSKTINYFSIFWKFSNSENSGSDKRNVP
jgi:hypothetical protein